jgi:transcriptional regulator with XRE-family HTH domain
MVTATRLTSQLEKRRRELRMSKTVVARRAGVSLPTVNRILSGKEKRPGLPYVQAIAEALGVEVRLAEVADAYAMREQQATEKARQLVGMVQSNMALEGQGVGNEAIERMVRQTVHELMAGPSRRLWED